MFDVRPSAGEARPGINPRWRDPFRAVWQHSRDALVGDRRKIVVGAFRDYGTETLFVFEGLK